MQTLLFVQLFGGAIGAILGQIVQYIHSSRIDEKYGIRAGLISVVISSIITFAYFTYIEETLTVPWLQLIGYGFFISMVIEESKDFYNKKAHSDSGRVAYGSLLILLFQQDGTGLTLNNGWSVFGIGILGATAAELIVLYRQRETLRNNVTLKNWEYWSVTVAMVIFGGIYALIFCGTKDVSGYIALQIGAGAQFGVERLFRNQSSKD
jgi:hypothetical protein